MPEKMGMYPFIDTGPLADYTELSSKIMVCKRKYAAILFNIKEIRFGFVLVWMNQKELIEAEMNSSPEKLKEIDSMANVLMTLLKSNPNLLEQLKSIKK